jgi:hypothetical protein
MLAMVCSPDDTRAISNKHASFSERQGAIKRLLAHADGARDWIDDDSSIVLV